MAEREIKATLKLEGENQFKSAMKGASDSIKVLNSEQKLAQAQFEATGNKQQFLADKADILKRKIEEQQKAVNAAQEAVRKLKDQGVEPTNRAMQEWTRKLNDSQAYLTRLQSDLSNTESELQQQGDAFQDAGDAADDYGNQLKEIGEGINFQNVISSLDAVQQKLQGALTTIQNLAKNIWDAEVQASQWADDLLTAAQTTGVDVETLQSWQYAAQLIDTDVDTIVKAQDRLMKTMQSTSKDTQKTFNQLGVVTRNADGSMRDYRDTFWDVITALGKGKDAHGNLLSETDKDRIAQELFGKSYRDLLPLINAGRDAWDEVVEEGREHVAVSEENVQKLGALNDAIVKVNARLDYTKNTALAALAPALTDATDKVSSLVDAFNDFLKTEEGRAALEKLGDAVGELIDAFIGDVDFEQVINTATAAIEKLTDVLKWIGDHSELVVGALVAMKAAVTGISVAKSVLQALELMKSIKWLNMSQGAKNLGDALGKGAEKTAEELAKGGGGAAAAKGASKLASFASVAAIGAMYAATITAPVWGTALAENRDFGRFWKSEGQVDSVLAIEAAGDKKISEAQVVLDKLQAVYKEFEAGSGGGLTDEQAKTIFATRDEVEKATGKTYEALDALKQEFDRNGGNTAMTDYDLQVVLGEMIADLVERLKTDAEEAGQEIKDTATETAQEKGEQVVEEAGNEFDSITDEYLKRIEEAYSFLKKDTDEATKEMTESASQGGTDVANGLADGISGNASAASDAAGDMAQGVQDAVTGTLDIHSPSRVMYNDGVSVAQGLADGINAGARAAIAAAQNLAAQVAAALAGAGAGLSGLSAGLGRTISASPVYSFAGGGGSVGGTIQNVINISGKTLAKTITPFVNQNMASALKATKR